MQKHIVDRASEIKRLIFVPCVLFQNKNNKFLLRYSMDLFRLTLKFQLYSYNVQFCINVNCFCIPIKQGKHGCSMASSLRSSIHKVKLWPPSRSSVVLLNVTFCPPPPPSSRLSFLLTYFLHLVGVECQVEGSRTSYSRSRFLKANSITLARTARSSSASVKVARRSMSNLYYRRCAIEGKRKLFPT